MAAKLAGVETLVLHTGGPEGRRALDEAELILDDCLSESRESNRLLEKLAAVGFKWGQSDGN